jgi:hypothetical protein
MAQRSPAFYVIYDTKSRLYAENCRFDIEDLNQVHARYARPVGAQKDITKMESRGIDVKNAVIVPVYLNVGHDEIIKPKLRDKKEGFVIKISTVVDYPKKGDKKISYWKGNKAVLPESVDQIFVHIREEYKAKGYMDAGSAYRRHEHYNSALFLAAMNVFGSDHNRNSVVSATVFPNAEKASAFSERMTENLNKYLSDYKQSDNEGNQKGKVSRSSLTIEKIK